MERKEMEGILSTWLPEGSKKEVLDYIEEMRVHYCDQLAEKNKLIGQLTAVLEEKEVK